MPITDKIVGYSAIPSILSLARPACLGRESRLMLAVTPAHYLDTPHLDTMSFMLLTKYDSYPN
jgi:hypothetical protein